eukprot:CAMPEP_0184099698 /NCGR_PEP_ID=MMETSP0974-20121125/11956_1 /TAXON_ID=483370 /ORGANISM="non described non described, Strain CCMP2097" /LENGTH=122 /DNA_ID=CAMNT_0026402613 /DNA_START=168 /DNA_END=533 /DNA_ORIENTATION=+
MDPTRHQHAVCVDLDGCTSTSFREHVRPGCKGHRLRVEQFRRLFTGCSTTKDNNAASSRHDCTKRTFFAHLRPQPERRVVDPRSRAEHGGLEAKVVQLVRHRLPRDLGQRADALLRERAVEV